MAQALGLDPERMIVREGRYLLRGKTGLTFTLAQMRAKRIA